MIFQFSGTDVQPCECQWSYSFQCKYPFNILLGVWNLRPPISYVGMVLTQGAVPRSVVSNLHRDLQAFTGVLTRAAVSAECCSSPGSSWKSSTPAPRECSLLAPAQHKPPAYSALLCCAAAQERCWGFRWCLKNKWRGWIHSLGGKKEWGRK